MSGQFRQATSMRKIIYHTILVSVANIHVFAFTREAVLIVFTISFKMADVLS